MQILNITYTSHNIPFHLDEDLFLNFFTHQHRQCFGSALHAAAYFGHVDAVKHLINICNMPIEQEMTVRFCWISLGMFVVCLSIINSCAFGQWALVSMDIVEVAPNDCTGIHMYGQPGCVDPAWSVQAGKIP